MGTLLSAWLEGAVEGSKALTAATQRKTNAVEHWFQSRTLRGAEVKIGRGMFLYDFASMLYANLSKYSMWCEQRGLTARVEIADIYKVMSIEIGAAGPRTCSRGERSLKWLCVGLSIAPLPSTITVSLKVFLPLTVDYRKEIDKLPNNWATEFSEKMNTAEKPQLMPSVSSGTPLGPSRNSSGRKNS